MNKGTFTLKVEYLKQPFFWFQIVFIDLYLKIFDDISEIQGRSITAENFSSFYTSIQNLCEF